MGKLIYIDMDDTLADFSGHPAFEGDVQKNLFQMYSRGFFRSLEPIDGALVAVRALAQFGFNIQILTQPLANSPHSYTEKAEWIARYFPELVNSITMTQDKGRCIGDFLIDDNARKWEQAFAANGGEFIHFDPSKTHSDWPAIVLYLKQKL